LAGVSSVDVATARCRGRSGSGYLPRPRAAVPGCCDQALSPLGGLRRGWSVGASQSRSREANPARRDFAHWWTRPARVFAGRCAGIDCGVDHASRQPLGAINDRQRAIHFRTTRTRDSQELLARNTTKHRRARKTAKVSSGQVLVSSRATESGDCVSRLLGVPASRSRQRETMPIAQARMRIWRPVRCSHL
jgi:hypothetical protein